MLNIKLIFNNETKKLKFPKDFDALEVYAKKAFTELPQGFKFFYIDGEGDTISVTNDDDLQSFKESSDKPEAAKLIIAKDQDQAVIILSAKQVGNDTFRISQNFGSSASNPVADQSQIDYYSVPKQAP